MAQALTAPRGLMTWAIGLALAGCATGPALVKDKPDGPPLAPESAPDPKARPDPKAPPPKPPPARRVETGIASWYGRAHHGQRTASGESYDMYTFTAAHRTLPLGTRVLVTNTENDHQVEVRINDRGPYVRGRILDLSYAAARQLGPLSEGTFRVNLRILAERSSAPERASSPARSAPPATRTAGGAPPLAINSPARRRGDPPRRGRSTRCRRARP